MLVSHNFDPERANQTYFKISVIVKYFVSKYILSYGRASVSVFLIYGSSVFKNQITRNREI